MCVWVQVQKANPASVLEQYRTLALLREKEIALTRGWFCYVWADGNVFAFLRELDGLNQAFLVLLNFGEDTETNLSSVSELPDHLTVHFSTQPETASSFSKSKIRTSKGQGLLLKYSTSKRFHPNHESECYVSEKACFLSAVNFMYQC